jgi:SAM-dependent methyltransferase
LLCRTLSGVATARCTSEVSDRAYYDEYWSPAGFNPTGQLAPGVSALLTRNLRAGVTCLDFGCGDGMGAASHIRRLGCSYVGVDISFSALLKARSHGLSVCQIGDASRLPFKTESFQAITSIEVLEHLFRPELALKEFARVLRKGGVLIVTVPNPAYWHRRVELALMGRWNPYGDDRSVTEPWRDPHIRFLTRGALNRLLQECGFRNVTISGHGGGLPWLRHHLRVAVASYTILEKRWPAMLAANLSAVAYRV